MDIGLLGKLLAGGILGLGLVWLIWRKLTQGEARAVELAGRQAQQQVEAEARAAETAIREAAEARKNQSGPVVPGDWKFALLIGALALMVCAVGCGDLKAVGVSRWPMIQAPAPLEYTPEEQGALVEFSTLHPDLARKIVNQAQAMRAAIQEYNRRAWDVNAKQLKSLDYSDEDIVRLLGKKP